MTTMMAMATVVAKKNAFQFTNNLTKSTTHISLIHLLIMCTLSRWQWQYMRARPLVTLFEPPFLLRHQTT